MGVHGVSGLLIYPEEREAIRPTTNKIIDIFEPVSTYSIMENGKWKSRRRIQGRAYRHSQDYTGLPGYI